MTCHIMEIRLLPSTSAVEESNINLIGEAYLARCQKVWKDNMRVRESEISIDLK